MIPHLRHHAGSRALAAACLLGRYSQHHRLGFSNPIGHFGFALTDWLVLPLRRVLPAIGRCDTASLVAAWLLELAQLLVLWLVLGRAGGLALLPVLALFGLARLAISALTGLMIVYAILSWVRADSPMADIIERLCTPLLRPFRRVIPLVGVIDLAPLALRVLLQVGSIVLAGLQAAGLR